MKKAFIINGAGGAGKDTFVEYIQDKIDGVINISSVTEVKFIANKYFGWQGEKTLKWRKVLSDLKLIQSESCDGPFNYMKDEYENGPDGIYFFHVREPDEIKKMVEYCNAKTVLMRRSEQDDTQVVYGNMADDGVYDYTYDIIVINDTLPRLEESAKLFINEFISEEYNDWNTNCRWWIWRKSKSNWR